MLQNAYFLAKIGADTAENERNFAEILTKNGNYPTGAARVADWADVRAVGRGEALQEPRRELAPGLHKTWQN